MKVILIYKDDMIEKLDLNPNEIQYYCEANVLKPTVKTKQIKEVMVEVGLDRYLLLPLMEFITLLNIKHFQFFIALHDDEKKDIFKLVEYEEYGEGIFILLYNYIQEVQKLVELYNNKYRIEISSITFNLFGSKEGYNMDYNKFRDLYFNKH